MRNEIRKIILEEIEEIIGGDNNSVAPVRDSVDDQIDSFILKYENDSVLVPEDEGIVSIQESFNRLSISSLLSEQDEEDADEQDEEIVDEDPEAEAEEEATPEIEEPKMDIDIDSFTERIARLTLNSDVLLDVKAVILERTFRFLRDNYGQDYVDKSKQILEQEFNFDLTKSDNQPRDNYAVGAWAGGTGGLGGGGG
tara:strand:+ start:211 stop:801 length:591 start_codon:yes stop_codon:yes gene_type:complete